MIRIRRCGVVVALAASTLLPAWLGASPPSHAAVTGNLQVEIVDEEGAPLPGATVEIRSPALIGSRSLVTDAAGVARFNALPPGEYSIRASFAGRGTVVSSGNPVRLDSLSSTRLEIRATMQEDVVVVAEAPLVDVTSTSIGQDLDIDYVETLPNARTYQTNLNLVPGIDIGTGGNPVVHGGTSRDNLYLIDGINTTDPVTQTFGANINFDIIDEQQIHTGGHKAEYGGVVGAVSNLVTKSGGNAWSGSLKYFRQDADWAADVEDASGGGAETTAWTSAYTLGGPVLRDRLWHFSSWEINETEQRTVRTDGSLTAPLMFQSDYYFGKLSWQATRDHRLDLQINGDPTDIPNDNANDITLAPDQYTDQEQGGANTSLRYTGVLGPNLVLEAQATAVRGELNSFPNRFDAGPNTSSIFGSVTDQIGRNVNEQYSDRDRDELKADLSWFVPTGWGHHNLKFGMQYADTEFRSLNINSGGESYTDVPAIQAGSFDDFGDFVALSPNFAAFRWIELAHLNPGWSCSIGGVDCDALTSLTADPTNWIMNVPDGQGGTLTFDATELGLPTSVNPAAAAAGWRRFQRSSDSMLDLADPVGQEIVAFYAQDEWQLGRFTTYAGLRVEQQTLRDSGGNDYFEFDTTVSPRVGLTWDVRGDGRSKAYAHFGRLYDPVADGTTDFGDPAGDPLLEIQLWVDPLQDFFTFFSAGGPGAGQAVVAPDIETPVTDEWLLGYAVNLTDTMSLEATLISRETENPVEDLDPTRGPLDGSPTLAELGFDDENGDGVVDDADLPAAFVVYNPPGARREYDGVDLVFRKRFADAWSALVGYTYGEFEGNLSEDAGFGIVGDDAYLDPRLAYNYGPLGDLFAGGGVGHNDHFFKASGSYRFPFGLTVGTTFSARSGTYYSLHSITTPDGNTGDSRTPTIWNGDPALLVDSLGVDRGEFATELGIPATIDDGSGAQVRNPALDEAIVAAIPFDLRAGRGAYENDWVYFFNLGLRYQFPVFRKVTGQAFLDVFNVFDVQHVLTRDGAFATTAAVTPSNIGDRSIYTFQRPLSRQLPRTFQLGLSFSF